MDAPNWQRIGMFGGKGHCRAGHGRALAHVYAWLLTYGSDGSIELLGQGAVLDLGNESRGPTWQVGSRCGNMQRIKCSQGGIQ